VDGPGVALLTALLRYLAWAVAGGAAGGLARVGRFELAHAHVGLALEAHADTLAELAAGAGDGGGDGDGDGDEGGAAVDAAVRAALRGALRELRAAQAPEGAALRARVDKGLAMLSFFLGQ
jgi:hypothetical protein